MKSPTPKPQNRLQSLWPVALVVAAVLLVFGRVVAFDFTSWDDPFNIWRNPRINPPTISSVLYYWSHAEFGLYVPLTYTAWALLALVGHVSPDAQGVSLNPYVFHAANVAAHVAAAYFAFKIIERIVGDRRFACFGALVFALHPVQVESVAWAAGLKDVLSGALVLASVWQYTEYALQSRERASAAARPLFAATACFILAVLAKPSAVVAPAIAFSIDFWIVRRDLKRAVASLAPWIVFALGMALVGRMSQPATGVPPAPVWSRPLIAGDAIAFYAWKIIWPFNLAIDYGRRPAFVLSQWWIWLTGTLPFAAMLLVWLRRNRRPVEWVALAIFVAALFPVLGFATFLYQFYSTTTDHYLYVAMLAAGLLAAEVARRAGKFAAPVASVVVVGLAIRTVDQQRYWASDERLYSRALSVNPDSFLAMSNLGRTFVTEGKLEAAERLFVGAIGLYPDYLEAHDNLAGVLRAEGRPREAFEQRLKALDIIERRARSLRPDIVPFWISAAEDALDAGRIDEARTLVHLALLNRPGDPRAMDLASRLDAPANRSATNATPTSSTAP